MCTIIGYKSLKISENTIHKALESTYSRGPDDERIQQVGCGYLGFTKTIHYGTQSRRHAAIC